MEYKTCVDWFRGVVEVDNLTDLLVSFSQIDDRLSLSSWVITSPWRNYAMRLCHKEMPSFSFGFNPLHLHPIDLPEVLSSSRPIMILTTPTKRELLADDEYSVLARGRNPGVLLNLSGDACRWLGDDSLKALVSLLAEQFAFHCTRLDIALDIDDSENEIVPLFNDAFSNFWDWEIGDNSISTPLKRSNGSLLSFGRRSTKFDLLNNWTMGTHGSKSAMLRLYDKLEELKYAKKVSPEVSEALIDGRDYYWRLELEMHNDFANKAFYFLTQSFSPSAVLGQMLPLYCKVVITASSTCASASAEVHPVFLGMIEDLLQNAHFVQLVKDPFVPDSEPKYRRYLKQIAVSFAIVNMIVESYDPDLLKELNNRGVKILSRPKSQLKYNWLFDKIYSDHPPKVEIDYLKNTNQTIQLSLFDSDRFSCARAESLVDDGYLSPDGLLPVQQVELI